MEVGFCFVMIDRVTGAARLGNVDVHRDLAETTVDYQRFKEVRVVKERLTIGIRPRSLACRTISINSAERPDLQ